MRLLVVEDDPAMAHLLRRALVDEGYVVDVAATGEDALFQAREVEYDGVLLDVMIPAPDGFEVLRRMRADDRWCPILMLTARGSAGDVVRGLDLGADDYLAKPFELDVLFARLRSLTRRAPRERPVRLVVGDLTLDPVARTVQCRDVLIDLTPREFRLLAELMRNPDVVLSRSELLDRVWDGAEETSSNIVDSCVRHLRDKIDRPFGRTSIATVRGAGYRLLPC